MARFPDLLTGALAGLRPPRPASLQPWR